MTQLQVNELCHKICDLTVVMTFGLALKQELIACLLTKLFIVPFRLTFWES